MNTIDVKRFGLAVGTTLALLYLGCVFVMATAGEAATILFFNSLLHGIDVTTIIRMDMPLWEATWTPPVVKLGRYRTIQNLDCTSTFGLLDEHCCSDQDEYSLGNLPHSLDGLDDPPPHQAMVSSVLPDCHLPPSQDPVGTSSLTA